MMKLKKYIYGVALGALSLTLAACYNADKDFQDYEGGAKAYFAYQNPIRTLVLGTDIYDNELDNAHKCQIWSTMGGAYGGRDAVIDVIIDESLCENLYFLDDGGYERAKVAPLPHDYYNYDEVKNAVIRYNGNPRGYLEIQFTDKFFQDPKTTSNDTTYVIPVRMVKATGIDAILSGTPNTSNPVRQNAKDWSVLPMDYVLYCVRYMNPWQGKYIRRGVDNITENDVTTTNVRKDFSMYNSDTEHYTENPVNQNDEVCGINTKNMAQAIFPVSVYIGKDADGSTRPSQKCNLVLTFNGNKCTITGDDEDIPSEGSGEFIVKGTERPEYKDYQWGNNDGKPVQRDILRLAYNVTFKKGRVIGKKYDTKLGRDVDWVLENDVNISTADTLVVQTRESNQKVFFSPKYVKQ